MGHPLDNYCGRCRDISCDGDCGPETEICEDCGGEKPCYEECKCFAALIEKDDGRYNYELERNARGLFQAHKTGDVFAVNLSKILVDKGILTREETLRLFS